jgi:hypothetical protein
MGGKIENVRCIANKRIEILNTYLEPSEIEMYQVPTEPNPTYIRCMVSDLDWILESVEVNASREDPVFDKYNDVRERLSMLYELLKSDSALAK